MLNLNIQWFSLLRPKLVQACRTSTLNTLSESLFSIYHICTQGVCLAVSGTVRI